jgi:hypothetical protein
MMQLQLIFGKTFHQLDAQRRQLIAHRRINVRVAARHAVAGGLCDGRDAAHESAADAEDVKVQGHRESARFY